MQTTQWKRTWTRRMMIAALAAALALGGCKGSGGGDSADPAFLYALVACANFSWADPQNNLTVIQLRPGRPHLDWWDGLENLGADPWLDPVARTAGGQAYVLQREYFSAVGLGSVAVLDADSAFAVRTVIPVHDGANYANPNDLLPLGPHKAYVTRFEPPYNDILILDLQTGLPAGTIDFTGRGTNADGLPRLTKMLPLPGRVLVLMQNINAFFSEYGPGLLGVVDPQTDTITEVVALTTTNPADLALDRASNTLFVAAGGDWINGPGTGGIELVDPETLVSQGVSISGDELGGFIWRMALRDAHCAFVVVSKADWSGAKLVQVDPTEGLIIRTLWEYPGAWIPDLLLDGRGHLLIADASSSQVVLMDADSGRLVDRFHTSVPPQSLALWSGGKKL